MEKPQIGLLLPTRELAISGVWDIAPLLDFAQEAEAIGYDSLWIGDSLLARPRLDSLVVLASVAAVTKRIVLGMACLIPVLRNPVIGASLVTSLDQAISNRFELAVGSGFPIPAVMAEFAAAQVPFDTRVGRCDDTVRLWRQAWRSREPGADTTFRGRYWQVTGLDRLVPAATPAGPRIWYAGSDTAKVVKRVAELYDGWLPFLPSSVAYEKAWQRIQKLLSINGRPVDAVVPGMYATIAVHKDRNRARDELSEYVQAYYGYPLEITSTVQAFGYGPVEECVDFLAGYVRAGARNLVIRIGSLRPTMSLQGLLEALRELLPDCEESCPMH